MGSKRDQQGAKRERESNGKEIGNTWFWKQRGNQLAQIQDNRKHVIDYISTDRRLRKWALEDADANSIPDLGIGSQSCADQTCVPMSRKTPDPLQIEICTKRLDAKRWRRYEMQLKQKQ